MVTKKIIEKKLLNKEENVMEKMIDNEVNEMINEGNDNQDMMDNQDIIDSLNTDNIDDSSSNDFNWDDLTPSESISKNRTNLGFGSDAGILSIINHKCGMRLSLSEELLEKLNNPKTLQVAFLKDKLILAESIPTSKNKYLIKQGKKKGYIYSAPLVKEITQKFKLDFSNRSSITFLSAEYITKDNITLAIIEIPLQ